MDDIERRTMRLTELRAQETDGAPVIRGYAAVFDVLSEDLGGFRERIRPGAFAASLHHADVRALWNHNPDYVLGRTKSNTLRMVEDANGLAIEIDPPETTWGRDLMTSIKRGDVDQMSFGFRTVRDEWTNDTGAVIRTLLEVELFDVSPVTYPAYPQTSVNARAMATKNQPNVPGGANVERAEAQARNANRRRRIKLEQLK